MRNTFLISGQPRFQPLCYGSVNFIPCFVRERTWDRDKCRVFVQVPEFCVIDSLESFHGPSMSILPRKKNPASCMSIWTRIDSRKFGKIYKGRENSSGILQFALGIIK